MVLIGGYMFVSGVASHDPWGFSTVIAAVGFVVVVIGVLLFALARGQAKRKP